MTDLSTPIKDAKVIAAILEKQYSFQTEILINATRNKVFKKLKQYKDSLNVNDNLIIYYAGHGVIKNGKGYWVPVDGDAGDTVNWIGNDSIKDYLIDIKSNYILLISDSCFSGTFTKKTIPILSQNVSKDTSLNWIVQQSKAGKSREVLTSGGNEPVDDGEEGGNHSVFAKALINALTKIQEL